MAADMTTSKKWILRALQTEAKEEEAFYNRHRKDVITLFDVYCEVDGRADPPKIAYSYPSDFTEAALFDSIRRFAFPCGTIANSSADADSVAVQLFTFVLTEGTGNFTYAYCRYAPSSGVCACILSGYCYTTLFYKLLNHLSMARASDDGRVDKVEAILHNGYHQGVPSAGETLELSQVPRALRFRCDIPSERSLPILNDDKIFMEFFNLVESSQMIALFTALLYERRIVITGQKLGQLTACCFALTKILYPFHWQYTFVPLMPRHLLDMLSMPMPFIIGLPKELYESAPNKRMWSDYVLFDLDTKVFESPSADSLPPEIHAYLRQNLKLTSHSFLSDNFSRTFLRAHALIFGRYRSGYTHDAATREKVYDIEQFISHSRPSIAPFLRDVILQNGASYFSGFVTERLRPSREQKALDDAEFESEILAVEKRLHGTTFLQTSAPEALHIAMSNLCEQRKVALFAIVQGLQVKDGATDVIGSLKGKVQAMSLKEKLRFAPRSGHRKKRLHNVDTMCVDTSDFGAEEAKCDGRRVDEAADSGGDDTAVIERAEEADLIDFSEDFCGEARRDRRRVDEAADSGGDDTRKEIGATAAPPFAHWHKFE